MLSPAKSSVSQAQKILFLESEIVELEKRLGGRDPSKIVKNHINLLHRYNEVKDATQFLIAKYALITHQTVRQIHEELELPLTD